MSILTIAKYTVTVYNRKCDTKIRKKNDKRSRQLHSETEREVNNMDKTTVKDYSSVLFSDAESLENVADDMTNIKTLTAASRIAVRRVLTNAIKQAESVTEQTDIDINVLILANRQALAFINTLDLDSEIIERSIAAIKSASEEVGAIADSLDTMLTAPENQPHSNIDD